MMACYHGRDNIVELLLAVQDSLEPSGCSGESLERSIGTRSIDVNKRNKNGHTAYDCVLSKKYEYSTKLLFDKKNATTESWVKNLQNEKIIQLLEDHSRVQRKRNHSSSIEENKRKRTLKTQKNLEEIKVEFEGLNEQLKKVNERISMLRNAWNGEQ
jgi:hypothetical protein